MKLTAKITFVFIALVAVVTLAVSLVAAHLEWNIFRNEHEAITKDISDRACDSLIDAWKQKGDAGLASAVGELTKRTELFKIEWVWFSHTESESRPAPNVQTLTVGRMETKVGRSTDGSRRIHTYVPIIEAGDQLGGLDVNKSMSRLDSRMKRIWWTSLGAIATMFLLSAALIAMAGAIMVGRPLEKLIDKTNRAAQGDFDDPLELRGKDEMAGLATALNQMCEQLQLQHNRIETETDARIAALSQLRHSDRLQTIGQLASGIAHELGTPLNVIQGHAELISSQKMPPDEVVDSSKTIKEEVVRMTNILRQLLNLARRKTGLRETTELNRLLRNTIELLHSVAHPQSVNLLFESRLDEASVSCDPEQIKQVFINLLMNAIQALPDGGNVRISVESVEKPPTQPNQDRVRTDAITPNWYLVRVKDNGTGIEPAKLEKIFEPFFTTKDSGEGTGLGLSIAFGIVQEHGGLIEVSSQLGEGTQFDLYLPSQSKQKVDDQQPSTENV